MLWSASSNFIQNLSKDKSNNRAYNSIIVNDLFKKKSPFLYEGMWKPMFFGKEIYKKTFLRLIFFHV